MLNSEENIHMEIKEKDHKIIEQQHIETETKIEVQPQIEQSSQTKIQTQINRCAKCNKKLKLTDIKCRCNNYFCSNHRYSDLHDCPFDYKNSNKKLLEKQNPTIIAERINKI